MRQVCRDGHAVAIDGAGKDRAVILSEEQYLELTQAAGRIAEIQCKSGTRQRPDSKNRRY